MNFNDIIQEKEKDKKNAADEALKHLAHRDRTTMEMRHHLEDKGFDREEIEKTIEYLADMHYIDDVSYVEKYVQYAISKGKGSVKIKLELKEKGIAPELLDDLKSYSEELAGQSERERAYEQALKVLGSKSITSYEEDETDEIGNGFERKKQRYQEIQKLKAKIARRLESLGFSRDVIFSAIEEVFASNPKF